MGITPVLEIDVQFMKSRDVLQLTGLTADQLREWTVRRSLIRPDCPAQNRGSEAKFSWQTVLLLRLAVVLKSEFHVELQAHRELLAVARKLLEGMSFPALWGSTLAIYNFQRCELLGPRLAISADEDVILLRLDRHLHALSERFGLMDPVTQLPLFPVIGLQTRKDDHGLRQSLKGASS